MANPQIASFQMTKEGDKYTFQYKEGNYIENIVGTTQEIAYLVFDKCVVCSRQNNPKYSPYYSWPPFCIEETESSFGGKKHLRIAADFLCKIEPEPDQSFWDELDKHFQRLMNLAAFS